MTDICGAEINPHKRGDRRAMFLGIVAWIAIGIVAAGFFNAYARKDSGFGVYDATRARAYWGSSVFMGVAGGPFSFGASMLFSGMGAYGWTLDWRPLNYCDELYKRIDEGTSQRGGFGGTHRPGESCGG